MRPRRAGGKNASIGDQSATVPAAGVSKNVALCVVLVREDDAVRS